MNQNEVSESAIFAAVAKLPAADRPAYLDRACGPNLQLRRDVESLLEAHDSSAAFLNGDPPQAPPTERYDSISEGPGTIIGPYKLMEQIGEGGFGLVFVAEQQHPVRRKVALKIIKPGMDTRDVIARFEAERQALALMDHPNIARVLDAGTTPTGRPYFVMELVKGISIIEYCDTQQLTARDRLALFVSVCKAVQHAHSKGIIHRDLKPSNVLVAPHDGVPVVKVIDFGVAKAIGQQLTEKTIYTRFAHMIGTPLYMSPEQAELNALDVDIRSDVYSLGVLLYELLTGTTPFDRQRFAKATYDEIRRIIKEEEPPKPSTRISSLGGSLSKVSTERKTDPAKLSAMVKGDLDWIVMKALEKDRSRRYETATALSGDVQRFLAEEPIEARPPTAWYRFRKAARRNRAALTTTALVAAALITGTAASVWQAIRATTAEHEAAEDRDAAIAAGEEVARQRDQAKSASEKLRQAQHDMLQNQYAWDMQAIPIAWEAGHVHQAHQLLDRQPAELRGFEWHYWDRQTHSEVSSHTLPDITLNGPPSWQFSDDGARVAQVVVPRFPAGVRSSPETNRSPVLVVWDVATRRKLLTHVFGESDGDEEYVRTAPRSVNQVQFSQDGKRILVLLGVAARADTEGPRRSSYHLRVLDVDSGKTLLDYRPTDESMAAPFGRIRAENVAEIATRNTWFSPDGRKVAAFANSRFDQGQPRRVLNIWDLESGAPPVTIECFGVAARPFSADGSQIIVRMREGDEQQLRTFDTATGEEVHAWNIQGWLVHISPDRARLASITLERPQLGMEKEAARTLTIWDAKTEERLDSFALPSAEPRTNRTARGAGGQFRAPRPTERQPSAGLYFNRDGTRLIFRVTDRLTPTTHIVFDPVAGRRLSQVTLPDNRALGLELMLGSDAPLLSPDGKRLVTHSNDKITIWDVETGRALRTLRGHAERIEACSITPDSRHVWSVDQRGALKQWELNPPEPPVLTAGTDPRAGITLGRTGVASSADGRWIATSAFPVDSPGGTVYVWNAQSGGGAITFKPQRRESDSPTGRTPENQPRSNFPPARQVRTAEVAISDDGRRVALAVAPPRGVSFSVEPTNLVAELTVWDVARQKELFHARLADPGYVAGDMLAFSPDGDIVAVGVGDSDSISGNVSIKMFDSNTGKEHRMIPVGRVLGGLCFSPDGRRLAIVAAPDGAQVEHPTLTVWDAATGDVLVTTDLLDLSYSQYVVAWSPDGGRLAVGGAVDSSITLHDARNGQRLATIELPDRGDGVPRAQLKKLAFTPDGRRIASAHVSIPDRQAVVQLWDAATGKELLNLGPSDGLPSLGPSDPIHIAFSADGHRLLQFEPLQNSAFQSGGVTRIRLTTWDATPRNDR